MPESFEKPMLYYYSWEHSGFLVPGDLIHEIQKLFYVCIYGFVKLHIWLEIFLEIFY